MVGRTGFEPVTNWLKARLLSQLSYTPHQGILVSR